MLTLSDMRVWVGERLQLPESDWYAENTILTWINKMGFKVHVLKKSIYVDGHEREDVVESRKEFIEKYEAIYQECWQLNDQTLEERPNSNAKFVLISQDEKIHHSNDVQQR